MPTLPERFAKIRIAVAYLGQAGAAGWWSSSFLTPNGVAIAQYNFPRAPEFAAVNATGEAAKRLHDARIGRRRCVHLFRLPLGDEMAIRRAILHHDRAVLRTLPTSREGALQVLEAEGGDSISVEAGPVQVGLTSYAFTEHGLAEVAKHYLAAFRQEIQCFPYFASAKK